MTGPRDHRLIETPVLRERERSQPSRSGLKRNTFAPFPGVETAGLLSGIPPGYGTPLSEIRNSEFEVRGPKWETNVQSPLALKEQAMENPKSQFLEVFSVYG
jgi:hypothetical protein